jgi:hypothetical protein
MSQGALLCSHPDCCPESQRITLGTTPEATDKFYNPAGELVQTITYPAETITMSIVLRDVVGRENGLYKLSCSHVRAGLPLISAQEYLTLENGTVLRGDGLPAPDSHIGHRATYRTVQRRDSDV